jgi:hypothetical protein
LRCIGAFVLLCLILISTPGVSELAGERWPDVAEQAPTVYAVWGGEPTPAQALYMVGLILPPTAAA